MKLYRAITKNELKVYKQGFLECRKPGFYDIVENSFYISEGNGSFVEGNAKSKRKSDYDINTPITENIKSVVLGYKKPNCV